jgi:ribosome-associated protein
MAAMPSRSSKAALGRQPPRDPDANFDDEGRPSKTQAKRESHELQSLGKAIAELPPTRLAALDLPEGLRGAIDEWHRTRSHEGKRRQMQYIGKLMRAVDPEPLRQAVDESKLQPAREALALHEAEAWREALIADDAALTRWAGEHPGSDVQRLRQLIRAARAGRREDAAPGAAQRQPAAWRELFRFIRTQLST